MDKKSDRKKRYRGIIERLPANSKPRGADETFAPQFTVNSTNDGGGQVLTNVEVILCFWGTFWTTNPPPSPSSDEYKQAIIGILGGPFMGRLTQYRGVGQGTLIYTDVNDTSDPANTYSNSDVVTMLKNRIQNAGMPAPASGHNRFYAVIVAPGKQNSNTQFVGQHQSFTYNGVTAAYAWIDNTGSLTGGNCTTKVFSHEFVEACTNPNVDTSNNGITVNDSNSSDDEIGDVCNSQWDTVDMNGVRCSVQSYWSQADNTCILPLGTLAFWLGKNSFSTDEVNDAITTQGGVTGRFSNAFFLDLEGYSIDAAASFKVSLQLSGAFDTTPGISIQPNPTIPVQPEDSNDLTTPQRIRFAYDVLFTVNPAMGINALAAFPAAGETPLELTANILTGTDVVPGNTSQASENFFLVAGANPYFSNVDASNSQSVFWLSQDLRVFTVISGQSPLSGAPTMGSDPYGFIQNLIGFLNNGANGYTAPALIDPLDALPGQGGFETGDSSVTPLDSNGNKNYNFAIARVRLNGAMASASNVRVFFRLWVAQSCDTDFNPGTTYPSTLGTNAASPDFNLPIFPLASATNLPPDPSGQTLQTVPYFATGSSGVSDYDPTKSNNNIQSLAVPGGQDDLWAYYACFLDVYDASNNSKYPGTHHCLVAQIAYDNTPIVNSNGLTMSPGNSDKLAQRNLQVTLSGNPGPESTHRVPQAFDTRPTRAEQVFAGVGNSPDELMIDWGNTPPGSTAYIYWPQVAAADVLNLAAGLYRTQRLSASDAHTIQCTTVKGVTYIPIPPSSLRSFAGLFTVNLPLGITTGQEFNIVVRRLASRQRDAFFRTADAAVVRKPGRPTRYVTGAFQVKIPVTGDEALRSREENTLAILKWRLLQMPPVYRWHPVVKRYIDYVSGRVDGSGGNASGIAPSPLGVQPPVGEGCRPSQHYTGKVCRVLFDCFGEFEGFVLRDCARSRAFACREQGVAEVLLRACRERLTICVSVAKTGKGETICGVAIECSC